MLHPATQHRLATPRGTRFTSRFSIRHDKLPFVQHRKVLSVERQQHPAGGQYGGGDDGIAETRAMCSTPVAPQQSAVCGDRGVQINQSKGAQKRIQGLALRPFTYAGMQLGHGNHADGTVVGQLRKKTLGTGVAAQVVDQYVRIEQARLARGRDSGRRCRQAATWQESAGNMSETALLAAQLGNRGRARVDRPGGKRLATQCTLVHRRLPRQILIQRLAYQGALCCLAHPSKSGKDFQVRFREVNLRTLHGGVCWWCMLFSFDRRSMSRLQQAVPQLP